jgi:hypothetical protein
VLIEKSKNVTFSGIVMVTIDRLSIPIEPAPKYTQIVKLVLTGAKTFGRAKTPQWFLVRPKA